MERGFLSGPGGVGLLGSQSVAFGGPWYPPFAQHAKDGAPTSYFLPAIKRADHPPSQIASRVLDGLVLHAPDADAERSSVARYVRVYVPNGLIVAT